MFQPPDPFFQVKPISPWFDGSELGNSDWQDDVELQKLFGIELGKHAKAFDAALAVFKEDTNKALWAANYWINHPVVVAARDIYAENTKTQVSLLDKAALSMKLLKFADEKDQSGGFYINEAKDRLAALKLYAEVQGYIGKVDINASTNNFVNNKLELIIVKSPNKQEKQEKVIDAEPVQETHNKIPLNLKLVGVKK